MRYIKLNEDGIIVATRRGREKVEGEIQSDTGQIGQKMVSEGVFEDVIDNTPKEPYVSTEEKIDKLQNDMDYLILKQEGLI